MWNKSGLWGSFRLSFDKHVVGWINCGHTSVIMLRSVNSWLCNLLGWCDTTVSSNIVDAVSWDVIWSSGIISILVSSFPVVSWPWVEVWEWSSFWFSIKLSNHVISWVNCSHSCIVMLRSIYCWLGYLLWGSDTTVSSDIVNAVSWDIVWSSWVISVLISCLPVVPWPWVEVWERSSTDLSNHIICRVNSSHTSIIMLWTINSWLSNLLWWSNTTVTCNIVEAMGWDIIWCSWVIGILISSFPVISWLWVEIWKWGSMMLVVVLMVMSKLSSLSTSQQEA